MSEEILSAVNSQLFGVWFLIGAALVFWMQAGFAMVETGFTRAKNAGNTGHVGDGKFFVYDVEQVVKVRTGELGYDALQGEE